MKLGQRRIVLLATLLIAVLTLSMAISVFGEVSSTPYPENTIELDAAIEPVALSTYKGETLEYGLWYAPYGDDVAYIQIYSIGGSNRIAAVSNYPRAYRDTANHVYEKDIEFTVTRDDYNTPEDDAYYDARTDTFYHIDDTATHWAGDPLPGAFPRWLEYTTPQPVTDMSATKFFINAVPAPIELVSISTLDLTLTDLNKKDFNMKAETVTTDASSIGLTDRKILYFHYTRDF